MPIYGFVGTLAYPAVNAASGVNELYTYSASTLQRTGAERSRRISTSSGHLYCCL